MTLIPVALPADQRAEAFAAFLRAHGVKALIKPASILGALEYFMTIPAILRATSPYEDLGPHRWHKLKRGALRIYVRIDESGRLLFHPYARKDWRKDLVVFAA